MAMPKKNSRRIIVGGQVYRWIVSPNDGFMTLAAELAENPGQRVEAFFNYHDLYEPHESLGPGALRIVGQRRSITPAVARTVIEAAVARGWQPSERGRDAFRIPNAELLVPLDEPS